MRIPSVFTLLICLFDSPKASSLSNNLLDFANMALRNSPSQNRFITNKMCPYAQKVWIALEASNSPFELQEISLYGNNGKPDWFLELNPAGTVPVLVTNGGAVTLCDSDVILDQMQRSSFGSVSLFPSEGQDVIQRWRTTVNSKLIPIGKKAVLSGRGISNDLKEALAELDSMVVGPYLAGESISTADCHAFPFLWRLNDEYRLDSFPKLKGWINKCSKEPPFKKTIQTSWWWWW